jgi:YVTN family beta-propeller protein
VGGRGWGSAALATVGPMGDTPFTINVDAAGRYVYVGNYEQDTAAVRVVDAVSNTVVASVSIGPSGARAAYLSPVDSTLYIAGPAQALLGGVAPAQRSGRFARVRAAGPESALIDWTDLSGLPSGMVFSESQRMAVVALPARTPDGVDLVSVGAAGPGRCAADINGDGTVDIRDFLSFLGGYAVGDPRTDFNADGVVNVQDFLAFIVAFATPCR